MRAILCLIYVACTPLLVSCKIGSHIISGTTASNNQFPYQAAISVTQYGGALTRCGGSLIDKNWVLTAAHCFNNADYFSVRLGSNLFSSGGQFWNLTMNNVRIHMHFNQTAMQNTTEINIHNNIALIFLPTSASINGVAIPTIPILPKSMSCDTTMRQFRVAGWGVTSDVAAGGQFSEELNYVNLTEISNDACMAIYSHIDPNQMCVQGQGTQSGCKGDAGSPIVSNGYVVAMVSWGRTTCTAGFPRVSQLVTPYIDWMKVYSGVTTL